MNTRDAETKVITTDGGVRVFEDYRNNMVIDPEHPLLMWKARLPRETIEVGEAAGLSRLGSENSEDALTWNYFMGLHRLGSLVLLQFATRIRSWMSDERQDYRLLFWGRDADRDGKPHTPLQRVLDRMEPWGAGGLKQQTESDVIVLSKGATIVIESKLGKAGTVVDAWMRKRSGIPEDYRRFAETLVAPLFVDSFDWEGDGQRFYQLMRNWILANALGRRRRAYLVAIVNGKTSNACGGSHADEFERFRSLIHPSLRDRAVILTWQDLYDDLCGCRAVFGCGETRELSYVKVLNWMENNRALALNHWTRRT